MSNEGSCALFEPLTLPIKGSTGCYASMETFVRDRNVEVLEKNLGVSIDDFVRACEEGSNLFDDVNEDLRKIGDSKYDHILASEWGGNLGGCYVEAGAYEKFSNFYRSDCGGTLETAYNAAWPGPHILRAVGFVCGEKDQKRSVELLGPGSQEGDRYHTPWIHPKMPEITLWSDQHMSVRIEFNGKIISPVASGTGAKKYLSSTHFFDDIETAIRQRGVSFPEEIKTFLSSKPLNWGHVRETLDRITQHDKALPDFGSMVMFGDRLPICRFGLNLYGSDTHRFENELTALSQFLLNMHACNRLLMPTSGGFQYGNDYMVHELSKYTASVSKSRHRKESYKTKFADSVSPELDDKLIAAEKARVEAYYESIRKK